MAQTSEQVYVRLLLCRQCQEINVLPDFQGRAEDDFILEDLVNVHRSRGGHDDEGVANIFRVPEKDWNDPNIRASIYGQMQKRVPGFESEWYATRDYYREAAGSCFNKHGRPKEGCVDYCDHDKRIGNPQREQFKNPDAAVYICYFCPVQSFVTTQLRKRRGDYDKHPGEED